MRLRDRLWQKPDWRTCFRSWWWFSVVCGWLLFKLLRSEQTKKQNRKGIAKILHIQAVVFVHWIPNRPANQRRYASSRNFRYASSLKSEQVYLAMPTAMVRLKIKCHQWRQQNSSQSKLSKRERQLRITARNEKHQFPKEGLAPPLKGRSEAEPGQERGQERFKARVELRPNWRSPLRSTQSRRW